MRTLIARARRFLASEDGPTSVEYALLLALLIVASMHIVSLLGTNISKTFSTINSTVGS